GDCGDQGSFCSRWRCRPGTVGADSRGCIDLGPPCDGGLCDEEMDLCGVPSWCTDGRDGCMAPGDCDGDGSLAPECGGDDCDDGDANRRPGNPEICDSEGHDEDCDPSTLGSTDDDGDGAISMACCNGATCGTDCDDASSEVAPSASEICNGIDDDCDGTIDIASASLCPGGLCLGGRCAFDAWDASFGTADDDAANAVAIDAAGNVYVAGHV